MKKFALLGVLVSLVCVTILSLSGCSKSTSTTTAKPKFSLAWSEYPSWSVFGVAAENGLLKEVADKYGIEVEAKLADYDACIALYGAKTVNAVCITNMDILSPSFNIPSTAIFPTSTSDGADALIMADGNQTFPDDGKGIAGAISNALKANPTYGLEKSVSEFVFYRCLQKLGLNPKDYQFKNMDPGAAALALQTGKEQIKHIMVWNPFVLQTLRSRKESKTMFDSSLIPGEVVDMVVVSTDTLNQPGGDNFARCLAEVYYRFNEQMKKPNSDSLYVQLGAKFSKLNAQDMRLCCTQTKFYSTASEGIAVYTSDVFKKNLETVGQFCVERGIVAKMPVVGFENPKAQLNFTTKYLK